MSVIVKGGGGKSSGQYVWKKCEQYTISIIQTTHGVNPTLFQVSVSGKELSELENLDGISGSSSDGYGYRFTATQMFYANIWWNYTFDNSTGIVSIPASAGTRTFSDCVINEFVDFVVSDSPTAYPDGAVHTDGYWYEKVVEGVAGVDFGEVTLASTATSVTVNHNLGVVPSWVLLVAKDLSQVETNTSFLNVNGKIIHMSSGYGRVDTENTITDTEITFNTYTYGYPYSPIDYYWLAIA